MKRFDSYFSSVCQLLKDIWMVVYAWMHNNANELISLSEIRALAWLSALALLYVCWKWHNSFHLCRCDIHANYCQFWHRIRYACLIFGAWWRGDGEWKNDMIRIALKIQSFMCLNKVGSANMMQAQIPNKCEHNGKWNERVHCSCSFYTRAYFVQANCKSISMKTSSIWTKQNGKGTVIWLLLISFLFFLPLQINGHGSCNLILFNFKELHLFTSFFVRLVFAKKIHIFLCTERSLRNLT